MDDHGVATYQPVGRRASISLVPTVPKPTAGWDFRHGIPPVVDPALQATQRSSILR